MAQLTFSQVWNRVLLYAPGTPLFIVQDAVRNAYNRCLQQHQYSELLTDGEKTVREEYETGTVSLTNGSTAVTGTATVWTAAMTGMQMRIGDNDNVPFYTFTFLTSTTGTLDREYEGPTDTSATYALQDLYLEFPSDLYTLDDIRDATRNWRLRRQYSQQNYIDFVDPKRQMSGTPWLYVAAPARTVNGVSYPRFEFWPRVPGSTHLVYRYYPKAELASNSDYLITMIKPEAVVYGALADISLWPGTAERPNPLHNMDTHKRYYELADQEMHYSEMADTERSQRMILYDDGGMGYPNDAAFAQAHGLIPNY